MSGSLTTIDGANPYASTITSAANQYGVPANLLYGLIGQESSFNPYAQNGNASGIAQFMPGTAQQYGVDVYNPTSSIYGAANYLSDLYNKTGSWVSAVTGYGTIPSSGTMTAGQQSVYQTALAADGAVVSGGQTTGPSGTVTTTSLLGNVENYLSSGVWRAGVLVIAVVLLIFGMVSLVKGTPPHQLILQSVKQNRKSLGF